MLRRPRFIPLHICLLILLTLGLPPVWADDESLQGAGSAIGKAFLTDEEIPRLLSADTGTVDLVSAGQREEQVFWAALGVIFISVILIWGILSM